MLEQQVAYIMRQIKRMSDENLAWMDIRGDVMASFNEKLQNDIAKVDVWQAECGNEFYYRAPSGRLVTQWPHSMDEFMLQTSRENATDFDVEVIA